MQNKYLSSNGKEVVYIMKMSEKEFETNGFVLTANSAKYANGFAYIHRDPDYTKPLEKLLTTKELSETEPTLDQLLFG